MIQRACAGCPVGQFKPLAWVAVLAVCCLLGSPAFGAALINEFHYDNTSTDVDEFIEVVLNEGTDPNLVTVTLYNGSSGAQYGTHALTTFTSHGTFGGRDYYSLVLPVNGLQNGAPDGIAIDIDTVLSEFLSYEGTFVAVGGPADGIMSVDVGVSESSSTPVGSALQRIDFGGIWCFSSATNTMGAINDCGLPSGSCCDTVTVPNTCVDGVLLVECIAPGVWTEGGTCAANCAWVGACCDPGNNWSCSITTEAACTSPTAYWVGGGTCEANCIAPVGSCCNTTTFDCWTDLTEFDCETAHPGYLWTEDGDCASCTGPGGGLLINEVDCDTLSLDTMEFIELYWDGMGSTALDGYVVVLYNGNGDVSYAAYDLDGFTTDVNGYFLLGNAAVLPTPGIILDDNSIQNGADAVALYLDDAASFPTGTAVTLTNLVDALVYDTSDADDPGLLVLLNAGQPQVNENGNGAKDIESMQRCLNGTGGARNTITYTTFAPTPAQPNCIAPTGSCCDEVTWAACFDDLTEDECNTVHPGATWLLSGDCVTCVEPIGSCCDDTAFSECLPNVTQAACTAHNAAYLWTEDGDCADCIPIPEGVIINEVDCDQTGSDTAEFIELFDGGVGNTALDGLVVVLFTGSTDTSYMAVDLDGYSTDGAGYFVIGSLGMGTDIELDPGTGGGWLQNGADAVALYAGNDTDFPNGTAVTTSGLIDALVYDTDDSDDAELLVLLNAGEPQINEHANGYAAGGIESMRRCPNGSGGARNTSTYYAGTPSLDADNACLPPDGACCNGEICTVTTEAACAGNWLGAFTTCDPPNPCLCTNINDARALGPPNAVALCDVTISNVISTVNSVNSKTLHIQDGTVPTSPRALTIYGPNAQVDAILAVAGLGDVINVSGTLTEYASLLELGAPLSGSFVSTGTVPAATVIVPTDLADGSAYAEQIESVRVKLECVYFMSTGLFAGSTDYWVTDGTDDAKVRIPTPAIDLVNTPIPTGPVDITGFVAQYDWGTGTTNYQVYLVQAADLVPATPGCEGELRACCYPDSSCVLASAGLCRATGGVWQGPASTCTPVNPCVAVTGACCNGAVCDDTGTEADCLLAGGIYMGDGVPCTPSLCDAMGVLINEVDCDTVGTDTLEFIELYDGGAGNTVLDGLVVVLYNGGSTDASYDAIDLDGYSTDANGYFLIGNTAVVPTPAIIIPSNGIQNGPDAVALFGGSDTDFPSGTPVTTDNLIDALVYDTNDADDPELLVLLNAAEPQINEDENGLKDTESMQRCPNGTGGARNTSSYLVLTPSPGASNLCGVVPCTTCPGDMDGTGNVDFDDIDDFVLAILSPTPDPCADVDDNGEINGLDVAELVNKVLANNGAGTSCSPPRDVIQCAEAGGPGPPCPNPPSYCTWMVVPQDPGATPLCVDVLPGPTPPFEFLCLPCPSPDPFQGCPQTDPVVFRWVNYDGLGNDCWFVAELAPWDCQDCDADPFFRFVDYVP